MAAVLTLRSEFVDVVEAGPNFAAWWAGVHVCEQLTQGCYAVCLGRGSNSRPRDLPIASRER